MPPPSKAPSGWVYFNHHGQPTLAIVPSTTGGGSLTYFSVRTLLDHDPEGAWSELNGYYTWESAMEFALEVVAE